MRYLELLLDNLIFFIIFTIPLIFWQPFFDPFGPAQLMVIRVFIPLLIFIYFLYGYIKGEIKLRKTKYLIPFFIYIAISFFSIAFSINKEISFKYFLEIFLTITGAFIIFSILDNVKIKRIIFYILFIHILISIYGIFQHFDMDFFKWNTNFGGRPLGTIGNPDFFAGELLLPVFLLLTYFVAGEKHKILTGISFFIVFLCLIYTKVVGVYIGFFAGFILFTFLIVFFKKDFIFNYFQKQKRIIFIFLAIIVVLIFLTPHGLKIAKERFADKKRSIIHRFLMWETSLYMIKDHPVFGTGFGTYRLHYPYYQGILLNNQVNKDYDYVVTWMPHQNYLLIAAETGILGLGAFLLIIFIFLFLNYDLFIKKKNFNLTFIGIFSGIFSLLISSFFNTFYNIPSTTLLFFLFLLFQDLNSGKIEIKNKNIIAGLITIAGIILFYTIVSDGKTLLANVYLKEANKLSKNRYYNNAINYYERIISLKPIELTPQMDVGYYYYAAETYREIGNFEKAKEYYEKDLKINPYCPEVNNMLGAIYGQLGFFDKSVEKLKMAVFVAPHYEAAYSNLATAYIAKGDKENAKNVLQKYIQINGKSEKIESMIAVIDAMK